MKILREEEKESIWILTEKGILDITGNPIDSVPFGSQQVFTADHTIGKTAVIVDRNEIWELDGIWRRLLKIDGNVSSIKYGFDGNLFIGT